MQRAREYFRTNAPSDAGDSLIENQRVVRGIRDENLKQTLKPQTPLKFISTFAFAFPGFLVKEYSLI